MSLTKYKGVLILFVFLIASNCSKYSIKTEIALEEKKIYIGKVTPTQEAVAYFKLINIGNNNFVIDKIETDCHCTGVKWSRKPVLPGDTTEIIVRYDKHLPGFFDQIVKVYSKDIEHPILLVFQGYII